jgi:outer membrane protease
MGLVPTERGKRIALGSLILHETAHTCSINHLSCDFEGIDNITLGIYLFPKKQYKETWGQYRSVMNYLYTNGLEIFDLSSGENGPPYDQDDWGMMFIGYFQYNMENLPESNGGLKVGRSDWWVTSYTYDENLTRQFYEMMGQYSPIDPIKVNWSVYTVIKDQASAFDRDIKVFAQPRIKTTRQWVLYAEGDLDSHGKMHFYSFDDLLHEKLHETFL